MTEENTFTFERLCVLSDLPSRTVRYYIQKGLVDRPVGETRAAYYTREHLAQLLAIKKWTQAGLSLERIGELLRSPEKENEVPARPRGAGSVEVWSHLVIADGLELNVEPGRAGLSPNQTRALFKEVIETYERIRKGGKGA